MNISEIIEFTEDKDFEINNNWYLHATSDDSSTINKILDEGIKSAYLRNNRPNHFNGKYYISLYKHNPMDNGLNMWLVNHPKIVVDDINPLYADRSKLKFRRMFINTRIPLRTSEWDGEYQQYLMIEPSKFVSIGYDLANIFKDIEDTMENLIRLKNKLQLLKDVILYMEEINKQLPIYDFSTKKEINKEKVLSLHI